MTKFLISLFLAASLAACSGLGDPVCVNTDEFGDPACLQETGDSDAEPDEGK